jgi:hypothetical protein
MPFLLAAIVDVAVEAQLFGQGLQQDIPVVDGKGLEQFAQRPGLLLQPLAFEQGAGLLAPGNDFPEINFSPSTWAAAPRLQACISVSWGISLRWR